MGKESQQEAYTFLLNLSDKQGYITFDDIINCADKWSLPIFSVDWLSSEITTRGILVYDEVPSSSNTIADDEFDDYAQSDYDSVFKKVVQLEPALEPVIIDIRNIIPPQYKEISQLKHQVKEGNPYARKRIVEMHLRLAVKIALQRTETFDMDIVDAFGLACIGLIIAVDRYDPDVNGAFGSYAPLWMIQNISREQSTQNPNIYYPVHKKEGYYSIYPNLKLRGCTGCESMLQCSKLNGLIQEKLGCTHEQTQDILLASYPHYSLETCLENMEDFDQNMDCKGFAFASCFNYELGLEEIVVDNSLQDYIEEVLSCLKCRERDVIIARYGLDGNKEKTLEEVGRVFHVTRERIRQIEAKALLKLRNSSHAKKLRDFY